MNDPYNLLHLHSHLQQPNLLAANIELVAANIQRQLIPHVDLVLHLDIKNLTGMTSDLSPFQGALVDVLALVIPVHIVDMALHRIEEERAQSPPDRRSPSYDFKQDDRTHQGSRRPSSWPPEPSNPPAWHQSSSQQEWSTQCDDYHGRPVTHSNHTDWQGWDAWGKWGDQSPHDTHPSWQDQTSYDTHSSWHDQQRGPPKPAARLSAAPQSFRSKPLTAFSSSHQGHPGKRKKPAKASWQQSRSDQSYHSRATNPIQKGHIKVSLKDDTQSEPTFQHLAAFSLAWR